MKNRLSLIGDKGRKPKDQRSKLDIVLRLSRLDAKSSTVLAISKVGFFL